MENSEEVETKVLSLIIWSILFARRSGWEKNWLALPEVFPLHSS
ncbi:hypothetical protein STRCR_1546 [Streptococcus criceti HS-6]|uniref:Uncharacterized protein n=1 Tax=Streptococcus criceti HS-6 TaxID=873449 RepID=G5JP15_STRCG|nr:hypothetical protein STRCR_1546 [Streptococcus criceti HS-6]